MNTSNIAVRLAAASLLVTVTTAAAADESLPFETFAVEMARAPLERVHPRERRRLLRLLESKLGVQFDGSLLETTGRRRYGAPALVCTVGHREGSVTV